MSLESIPTEELAKEIKKREAQEALAEFKREIAKVEDLDTARKLSANFSQAVRRLTI
jgi:hypothetical protein